MGVGHYSADFSIGNVRLHHIDCIEWMKDKSDNYYDLAIVDPPYGSDNIIGGYTSNKGGGVAAQRDYNRALWGQECPDKNYFDEIMRVSRNQIIWGANHFISKIPYDSSCWIVWDKLNGVGSSFADCELAWGSFKKAVRKFTFRWAGMLQGDMKNKEHRIHPTQKPVLLYRWILINYAKENDKILDTHGGSFSSATACHLEGFEYDGCEIDEEYYQSGCKRFENDTKQRRLFA